LPNLERNFLGKMLTYTSMLFQLALSIIKKSLTTVE
jgi:hypothetical protein